MRSTWKPLGWAAVMVMGGLIGTATAADPAASSGDREVWITMPAREMDAVRADLRAVAGDRLPVVLETVGGLALAATRESLLGDVADAMHARYHRCAGFTTHFSREDAQRTLRAAEAPSAPEVSYTIDNPATVNAIMGQVDQANIVPTIQQLASYFTRYYTTQTGLDASVWLKSRWEQIAAGRPDVSVTFFDHPFWLQHSVIVRINGTQTPNEAVVLGAHLDSIQGGQVTGLAPGADDDASGIASLTETFRAAMAVGYRPARTVLIMGYSGEAAGLLGSHEIALALAASNPYRSRLTVIGALQLDMTDYRSPAANAVDVGIIADPQYTNAPQNVFIKQLMDAYLPTLTKDTTSVCGYGCSDHASWAQDALVPASFPFEARFGQHNPLIHSVNDTLANSDPTCAHAAKFSRIAAAYMAELAKGQPEPTAPR
jgi:leucyl aminopeptidase